MAGEWQTIVQHVRDLREAAAKKNHGLWFRGQRLSEWKLRSRLHRRILDDLESISEQPGEKDREILFKETGKTLFYKFRNRAWQLLDERERSPWGLLFCMQHNDLPTRLLDWTESFQCAVFFAHRHRKPDDAAALFVLEPEALNEEIIGEEGLVALDDEQTPKLVDTNSYHPMAAPPDHSLPSLAVAPVLSNSRMLAQRAAFMLCGDSFDPLEELHTKHITTLHLPPATYDDVAEYLAMAGVGGSTYFPDLQGLCDELTWSMDAEVERAQKRMAEHGGAKALPGPAATPDVLRAEDSKSDG